MCKASAEDQYHVRDCVKLKVVEDLGALVDYFDFFLLPILCIYIFIILSPSVGVFLKKKIFFNKFFLLGCNFFVL